MEDGLRAGVLLPVPFGNRNALLQPAVNVLHESGRKVLGVYRFHSPSQSGAYRAIRSMMGEPQEMLLWHGTSWRSLGNILQGGFNRAYAGLHGSKFGVGTYFSRDAAYALRFCDTCSPRALLLARVAIGNYAAGLPGMLEPPLVEANKGIISTGHGADDIILPSSRRHDSTVDDCSNPRAFCIFRDFQAVPVALLVLA